MTTDTYINDNHIGDTICPEDTLAQGEGSIESTYKIPAEDTFVPSDTTAFDTTAGSTIFDTARLAGEVIVNQKKRVITFTRNLFLVTSGLVLGVVIALTASYKAEPVAIAATFHSEEVVTLSQEDSFQHQPQQQEVLEVEPRLKELEAWFQEQPVPVKERVFLHNAEGSLRTHNVKFQAPRSVESQYTNANSKPMAKQVKAGSDRFLADAELNIEWQGGFEASNPKQNRAKAAKYVGELEGRFGEESTESLKNVVRPTEGLLKGSKQRSFGPSVQ